MCKFRPVFFHSKETYASEQNNLLVTSEGRVQIADFGMSRVLNAEGKAADISTVDGNRCSRYNAPEQVYDSAHYATPTRQSDVWSFGSTVLVSMSSNSRHHLRFNLLYRQHLFTGEVPYPNAINDVSIIQSLSKKEEPATPSSWDTCVNRNFEPHKDRISNLCDRCWTLDVESRPSMTEVKALIGFASLSMWLRYSNPSLDRFMERRQVWTWTPVIIRSTRTVSQDRISISR